MLLISRLKSHAITSLPPSIPPSLWTHIESSSQLNTSSPGPSSPVSVKHRTFGQGSSDNLAWAGSMNDLSSTDDWLVKPEDKLVFDKYFDGIDVNRKGTITGMF